jgi:hypothetical protein
VCAAAQIAGFAVVFALFLACGIAIGPLTSSTTGINLFQALYFISSFFAQFVNATTFLLVRLLSQTRLCQHAAPAMHGWPPQPASAKCVSWTGKQHAAPAMHGLFLPQLASAGFPALLIKLHSASHEQHGLPHAGLGDVPHRVPRHGARRQRSRGEAGRAVGRHRPRAGVPLVIVRRHIAALMQLCMDSKPRTRSLRSTGAA